MISKEDNAVLIGNAFAAAVGKRTYVDHEPISELEGHTEETKRLRLDTAVI